MIYTETRVINRTYKNLIDGVPYIIHQGGTNSGKTFGVLYAILSYALYYKKDKKLKIDVVAETVPALKKGALSDFQTILELSKLDLKFNATDRVYTLSSGTKIQFFAVDKIGKAKHAKRDILFVNECNHVKYPIFKQLAMRTNFSVIMDYNPSGQFWFHSTLLPSLQQNEYTFTRTTYKDNPAVPEKIKRELENETDEYYRMVYTEGRTGVLKGLIYKNISLVNEMPTTLEKKGYGQDFGFSNDVSAFVECGLYQGEIYLNELIYESAMLNSDIVKRYKQLEIPKFKFIYCDAAKPDAIKEIKNAGYNAKGAKKGKGSIVFGIQTMQQYKINITKSSTNLIKEIRKYKWLEKDGELLSEPIDKDNHLMDAMRYWGYMSLTKRRTRLKSNSF